MIDSRTAPHRQRLGSRFALGNRINEVLTYVKPEEIRQ
jgi:hypothetical protein